MPLPYRLSRCNERTSDRRSSSRRMLVMRLRTMRRSTSSWLSPSPKRDPTPPPMRFEARWAHMPRRRGYKYWFWARRTCRRPSLEVACRAKMSRMRAVRSMTFTDLSMTFSRLACWEGVSSSSKMTRSASCDRASSAISSALPVPTKVRGLGASKRWVVVATTSAPAVSARRSSSAREDSKGHGSPGRSTPTRTARSRRSSALVAGPFWMTDSYSVIACSFASSNDGSHEGKAVQVVVTGA